MTEPTLREVRTTRAAGEVSAAREVERGVFRTCGFADVSDYEDYDAQSSFFGSFGGDGSCSGMLRLIGPGERPLPALHHMVVDEPLLWRRRFAEGRVAEIATAAVLPQHRDGRLFHDLTRLAYREALVAGVDFFLIIMEPKRVEQLNRHFRCQFRRVGPDQHYRGEEEITAVYAQDHRSWNEFLGRHEPEYLAWFRDEPFDASVPSPLRRSSPVPVG